MKPGLHRLTMAEYIALQAFSAGLAGTLLERSPYHAWHDSPWNPKRHRDDSNEADIGTYAHAMLLEGGAASLVIVDAKDWRTNAAKDQREAARAAGQLAVLQHKVAEVSAMVSAAREYLALSELRGVFESGAPEQTIQWEEGGVPCKARPDWLTEDGTICVSYKTTDGSAEPDGWIRRQLPQYDVGMVLYERGIMAALDIPQTRVVHLVQEQKPPYACALVGLAPAMQDVAERRLDRALTIWRECVRRNQFPAYPTRICYAEPTAWQVAEVEADANSGIAYDPAILFAGLKEEMGR